MLLAVNIGNTNISFAFFKAQKIKTCWDIPLRDYSKSRLAKRLTVNKISAALICSVVPGLSSELIADIYNLSGIKPQLIGRSIRVPIKTRYDQSQLGYDRLVNAYAASRIYKVPAIIISCGTAITIDAVSKDKVHLGGLIMPGLKLSLAALNLGTAQLPKLELKQSCGLLGKSTKSSILNGVILGASAAASALIKKIKLKIGTKTEVIGTGGDINKMSKFSPEIKIIDSKITLKGIALIYEDTKRIS